MSNTKIFMPESNKEDLDALKILTKITEVVEALKDKNVASVINKNAASKFEEGRNAFEEAKAIETSMENRETRLRIELDKLDERQAKVTELEDELAEAKAVFEKEEKDFRAEVVKAYKDLEKRETDLALGEAKLEQKLSETEKLTAKAEELSEQYETKMSALKELAS